MWSELDALYNLHVLTAEERVKILLRKPKILKDDVGGHLLLMADLRTVWREAEDDDLDRQLDGPEIIRDIMKDPIYGGGVLHQRDEEEGERPFRLSKIQRHG